MPNRRPDPVSSENTLMSNAPPRRAVIVARDDALRDSLALLLGTAGLETSALPDAQSLIDQSARDEDFIFIDAGEPANLAALRKLRTSGWIGTAVLMTEGLAQSGHANDQSAETLTKPFASEDVLAVIASIAARI